MSRGRPPKSLRELRLQGTFRRDRHKPMQTCATIAPRPPKWLQGLARSKWKEVARELSAAGILSTLDLDTLAAYCVAFATWRSAMTLVEKLGEVYKSGDFIKRNPAVAMMQAASR